MKLIPRKTQKIIPQITKH